MSKPESPYTPSPHRGEGWGEGVRCTPVLPEPLQAKQKPTKSQTVRARRLRQNSTDVEGKLWSALRAGQLGVKFRRQEPILGYTVDFVSHSAKLIIELDGGQHNGSLRDQERDARLAVAGFRVLRFWNNHVNDNLEGVLETILVAITEFRARNGQCVPPHPDPLPGGEREHMPKAST